MHAQWKMRNITSAGLRPNSAWCCWPENGLFSYRHSRHPSLRRIHPLQNAVTYRVNIKSSPLQLLLIFQQCMKIFAWNFPQPLSRQIYTLSPSLLECDKLISTKTTPNFSAFQALSSPVVCWWLWKGQVCWWWYEDADAWSDHHLQPQPRGQSGIWWRSPPPCWCVLVAALPKWAASRFSTHKSSYASAGVYGTFSAWWPRCDSAVGSNLQSLTA